MQRLLTTYGSTRLLPNRRSKLYGLRLEAIYIGPVEPLQGKIASVIEGVDDKTLEAQFHDVLTGFGFEWHEFARRDFRVLGRFRGGFRHE